MPIHSSGFAFYLDANLTIPLDSDLLSVQKDDGTSPPTDFQLWFGSPHTTANVQAESNPGTAEVQVIPDDDDPGMGHETTEIKLALTQGGLAAAVAGDPLDIGTEIVGGSAGAVEFWVRVDDATLTEGFSNELHLDTNSIILVQP